MNTNETESLYKRRMSYLRQKFQLQKGLVLDVGANGEDNAATLQDIVKKRESDQAKFWQKQIFGAHLSNLLVQVTTRK
jgi:hypothetical protein